MKLTKKKRVILASFLALVVIAALGLTLFFQITNGRVAEEDGLLQNSRIYLTDISVNKETGYISYTLHNGTNKTLFFGLRYHIQVKKNGEWVSPYPAEYLIGFKQIAVKLKPFSDWSGNGEFPGEYQLPGEYRIYKTYGTQYIVGYFTIPEAEP